MTISSMFHSCMPPCDIRRRATTSSSSSVSSFASFFTDNHCPHRYPLIAKTLFRFRHGINIGGSSSSSKFTPPNALVSPNPFLNDDVLSDLDADAINYQIASNNNPDELDISKLGFPGRLVQNLHSRGITHLFPVQRAVLIPALEGRDIIACVSTGPGKALTFVIPIIKSLTNGADQRSSQRPTGRCPRALVLTPTRALAKHVEKEIKKLAPYLKTVCACGGVSYVSQQNAVSRGVDVPVGTPGRIIYLLKGNGLKLREIEYLVIDEADQMLSFGFEKYVEVILENLPSKQQSMLFSSTLPIWIKKLARKYFDNPLQIDLVDAQEEELANGVECYAISATTTSKLTILSDLVMLYAKGGKNIVFTRTKRDADEVFVTLTNTRASEALHGDISQHQRERTLNGLRQGKFSVLVATYIESQGLDIPTVDLVIHYELPDDPETFVNCSGCTGCAGRTGTVILMFSSSQRRAVRSLEHDVGCKFEFVSPPGVNEVLKSSAEIDDVYSSLACFSQPGQKLMEEQGESARPVSLTHLRKKKPCPTVSALGRYICMPAHKVRRVMDQICGRSYEENRMMLELMPQRACYPILKCVSSAAANAYHNRGLDKANLVVGKAEVNEGATVKRLKPRAKGQSHVIKGRTCHISIVLEDISSFHQE